MLAAGRTPAGTVRVAAGTGVNRHGCTPLPLAAPAATLTGDSPCFLPACGIPRGDARRACPCRRSRRTQWAGGVCPLHPARRGVRSARACRCRRNPTRSTCPGRSRHRPRTVARARYRRRGEGGGDRYRGGPARTIHPRRGRARLCHPGIAEYAVGLRRARHRGRRHHRRTRRGASARRHDLRGAANQRALPEPTRRGGPGTGPVTRRRGVRGRGQPGHSRRSHPRGSRGRRARH